MTGETRRDEHQRVAAELGFGMADWPALGTTAQVVAAEPAALPTARAAVEKLLEAVDLAASRFRSDSELAGLNSAGGRWVPVSPLFARALRVAMDAARWTNGLVDPTVGGALLAAGYDRTFAQGVRGDQQPVGRCRPTGRH